MTYDLFQTKFYLIVFLLVERKGQLAVPAGKGTS